MTARIHLDTDLGGDPDDVAALAYLLARLDVDLVGITTVIDHSGMRAGYVRHVLSLAGREDVPVVAGARETLSGRCIDPEWDYWPANLPGDWPEPFGAVMLIGESVRLGATLVVVGPMTNLARFETLRPGHLGRARVVAMGGWVRPTDPDLPAWGPSADWNVQADVLAAEIVAAATRDLTLVTLADTLRTHLRGADLARLAATGPLGRLLAGQAQAWAVDRGHPELGRAHDGLPDDLQLFLHDPLACAVAVGWPGATVEEQLLTTRRTAQGLIFAPDPDGRPVQVVTGVDGSVFTEHWLRTVERRLRGPSPALPREGR